MSEKKSTSNIDVAGKGPGGGRPTTMATGEEDVTAPTTMATGEEGPGPTTMATGEEETRIATTLAVGEESSGKIVQRSSPFGGF
jgi:hypothetical protein